MAQPTTAKFGKMVVLLGEQEGGSPVAVVSLSNDNPAVVTVAAGDIGDFTNGALVVISGASGDMAAANGEHTIASVGTPANSFQLTGVDLSAAAAEQTTGITATPPPSGPIVYAAPCGLTTKGLAISKNLQEINIPDCDDPDAPIWLGRDVQNLSATISGDGVAAAESVPDWNDAAISTQSIPMKVEIEFTTGIKRFEGDFIVDNLTFGAEQGGRVTLSFNAQSDGPIQDTWTPV
jgi:hypothetical protein